MIGSVPGVVGHVAHQWSGGVPSIVGVFWVGFWLAGLWLTLSAATWWREHRPGSRPGGHMGRRPVPSPRSSPPSTTPIVRAVLASDAEREATSRVVAHAIGEGRLSLDEGRQRIDAAYGARHRHELAELVGDLPSAIQSSDRSSLAAPRRLGLPAAAATLAIVAALVQVVAGVWELWPVAVLALGALAWRPRR